MEFFEKAHTVRKSSRDIKKEEMVKKQLREMLDAYKNNDTEVIKQSLERKPEIEDILSTSSLMEYEGISLGRESDKEDTSNENTNNLLENSLAEQDISDLSLDVSESSDKLQNHVQALLDTYQNYESTKTQPIKEKDSSEDMSDISSNCSFPESSISDEFDADGQLASKIIKKLNALDVHSPGSDTEMNCTSGINNQSIGLSYPFENITVPDMSIKDLFHQYKHPTVRNIPDGHSTADLLENTLNSFSLPLDQESLEDVTITETVTNTIEENVKDSDHSILNDVSNVTLDVSGTYETDNSQEQVTLDNTADEDINTELTNLVDIFYCRKSCIFVLRHPAEIYLHGKVEITPMAGSVRVFGSPLDGPCNIFAPNNTFAQCIETLPFNGSNYGLFGKLTAVGLSVSETEDIVTTLGENDAVIMLRPLSSRKIDFVEQSFLTLDLFSKQTKHVSNFFKKASDFLGVSLYLARPWKYFEENPNWNQIINFGMNPSSRGVLCGGKGVGKSTFLRYYVNSLLARGPCLVVDLDPGQPEFTVAGCLSAVVVSRPLLGPNYTHLAQADRSLNIGMINVMDNLKRYTNAVSDLLAYCRSQPQYRAMPWIVNTMGMCNSVGLKLMALILLKLKPTFVVQFDSKNAKKRFECHLSANRIKYLYDSSLSKNYMFRGVTCPEHFDYQFFVSEQNKDGPLNYNSGLAPRDARYLNFLGYFGELMDIHTHSEFLGIVPYEISLRNFSIGANVKITEDDVHKLINGKIIALCQHNADNTNGTKMFRLDDKPALCLGHDPSSRGVLCGGKGVGKSTFLRYYVNSLLARGPCLVVDLDPGQPEFTVAGCLSAVVVSRPLLGPNYTHLAQADRSLNIGMINVMDNLKRYTNAVSDLLAYCRSQPQYRAMPWIVNTMGMCNSVGLKLMALILLKLKPTFVVQFDSKNAKKRFECHLSANRIKYLYDSSLSKNYMFRGVTCPEHFDYQFFVSEQNKDGPLNYNSGLAPRDARYLNFLGYFGELMDIHTHSEFLGIVPYEISLRNFSIGANVKITEDDVHKLINGKIIALCQHNADNTNGTKMFRLDDKPALCLGHGLVRGVDAARGTLYVATPAPRELLRRVDTLVYCDWAPELLGQARWLPRGAPLPYRTDTLPDHRQLMFTPKRRFNPIQLLKMARTT